MSANVRQCFQLGINKLVKVLTTTGLSLVLLITLAKVPLPLISLLIAYRVSIVLVKP